MTDQRQQMLKTATTAVRDIETLAVSEEFNRFLDHFKARADKMADEILHGDMPVEKREELRQMRLGILEVLRGPKEIHDSNAMLLKRHGAEG